VAASSGCPQTSSACMRPESKVATGRRRGAVCQSTKSAAACWSDGKQVWSTTYSEFRDLDRLREGSEHTSRLVHGEDEGDTGCRLAIAVFPLVLLWYDEQLVEWHAPFLRLRDDPVKIQLLHGT
jgi:hypothetical protein